MRAGNGGHTNPDAQAKTWLLPDQVDAMRDACLSGEVATYLQDRNEAIIALLYDTGLRRGEAAAVNVDWLNFDEGVLQLPAAAQKGNAPEVPLELGKWGADSSRILRRYLRDRWKDSNALFPSRESDRMTGRSIARVVRRAAVLAGVEPQVVGGGRGDPTDVTPHTLRHSVAYRIIRREGGRLEDVQLRLRHASLQTTDRVYSHLRPR